MTLTKQQIEELIDKLTKEARKKWVINTEFDIAVWTRYVIQETLGAMDRF